MINTIENFLAKGLLILLFTAAIDTAVAEDSKSVTTHHINNTVTHLEAALQAVIANELESAQEHLKTAGQSSKNIIGGSLEAKAQRGSRAISSARRLTKEGNASSAADSIKEALEVYKNLNEPTASGKRGGL